MAPCKSVKCAHVKENDMLDLQRYYGIGVGGIKSAVGDGHGSLCAAHWVAAEQKSYQKALCTHE
jgi:hypothetical protein